MRWGWKIGRLFGIEIRLHVTFFLLLAWVGLSYWITERNLNAVFFGISFIIAVFGCVVLHELGHALAAKRCGIQTRDITLLPIGGVARLERMPDDPKQEIWVALAGPAVNVVIALGLFLSLQLIPGWQASESSNATQGSFVGRLLWVNLFLVGFNLIPAFPMDGGRVLRGFLASWMNYVHATRIAATLGQGLAVVFGVAGLLVVHNPLLALIGVFIWIGAAQETNSVEVKALLNGVRVETAMLTNYGTLSPQDPLAHVADLILAGSQQDFPVVENERVVGVLTRSDLLTALAKEGRTKRVGDVMNRDFRAVEATEMLDAIVPRLQTSACKVIPVTRFGQLVGLITPENLGEFVLIKSALDGERNAA
jgi:Zn-dependent protease/predicted transcriptional regulator